MTSTSPVGVPNSLDQFDEELLTKMLEELPAERQLRGLPAEERVHGLSAEELAAALSNEEAAQLREVLERKEAH